MPASSGFARVRPRGGEKSQAGIIYHDRDIRGEKRIYAHEATRRPARPVVAIGRRLGISQEIDRLRAVYMRAYLEICYQEIKEIWGFTAAIRSATDRDLGEQHTP